MKKILEVKNISKYYEEKKVLSALSFDVYDGEFLSILGSSGCGKTTLIRILIGIEKIKEGNIFYNGEDITNFHPSKREMGLVFQNYALFPNMTVLENVMYPLNNKIKNKSEAIRLSMQMIEKVGLSEYSKKLPNQLSGGQMQRVAIARTLIMNPKIILMDEPMSALDADNRLNLRKEFKELQKKFNVTIIYITHDQEEAFSLSDRVMILNDGIIEQIDKPSIIFKNPKTKYVKRFVVEHLKDKVDSIEKCIKVDL